VDLNPNQDDPASSLVAAERPPGEDGYRRVLLKLSGETFGGGNVGVDPDVVNSIARQIAEVVRAGVQVAVVVGGGNFFRGAQLQQRGMDRSRADYMGMLGTVMNCLALQRKRTSKKGVARTRVRAKRHGTVTIRVKRRGFKNGLVRIPVRKRGRV
jgi:uridylate kinase